MDWLHAYEDELRVVFEENRRVDLCVSRAA